jgi:hypothetical protein
MAYDEDDDEKEEIQSNYDYDRRSSYRLMDAPLM